MTQGATVIGELVLKALPEVQCYTNFTEFLKALPSLYSVAVPSTVTNVIVSNSQPTSSQITSIWVRMSASNAFIGIYVFSGGEWVQVAPSPQEVIWMYGDSSAPPAGYKTTDDASGVEMSAAAATGLKAKWVAGALAGPPYEIFTVILE